ncbi:transcriptional repressor [Chryseobacterium sp. SSA4.19]|uniref:Fur family transcriptional regulator n=1 Tax=Chryseobacterium sp. SSA4.19 TaxID=2919915 RepID=UPI001F4DAAAA|nr:transcriptional repressor [Chryseobacterium sp. SSA4.19]MCJ8152343.1 transcriptional repressor [Chryseobacterium sp. SSA4.19]
MIKRNTVSKQMILEFLKKSKSAVSPDTLQKELGKAVDRATIYRVLNSFCEDGIIHKIPGDDGKFYFAVCINCSEKTHRHNHFHFKCIACGKIECLPHEMEVHVPEGYQSVTFNGLISGYCKECSDQ